VSIHTLMMDGLRELYKVVRGSTPTHDRLRQRVVFVVVLTLIIDLVLSVAIWRLERGAAETDVHGYGDALFWTSSQLLTVSSSMKNPLTTGGRVLDVFMELYAITVVATLAGTFGSFFHTRSREREREAAVRASAAPGPQPG
jgi:hypothetical protein